MNNEKRIQFTQQIVDAMKAGKLFWQKPWKGGRGLPYNAVTGKQYRGGNLLNLFILAQVMGWDDMRFMTFQHAKQAGWTVKTGSKAVAYVEFWNIANKEVEGGEESKSKNKTWARWFPVFHASQIEGIPAPVSAEMQWTPVEAAERLLANSPVPIFHDQVNRAFYSMAKDEIHLPPVASFATVEGYYSTAAHELVHASGHSTRCKRLMDGDHASPEYAFEELVAELGSVFLQAETGIEHDAATHAAYLQSWIKALENDHNLIFKASRLAQDACDFLLASLDKVEMPLAA